MRRISSISRKLLGVSSVSSVTVAKHSGSELNRTADLRTTSATAGPADKTLRACSVAESGGLPARLLVSYVALAEAVDDQRYPFAVYRVEIAASLFAESVVGSQRGCGGGLVVV